MKNSELRPTLAKMECLYKHHVSGRISFIIAKNVKKLIEGQKLIEEERVKMCEVFAEKDEKGEVKKTEDGKNFDISPENALKFNKAYNELLVLDSGIEFDYYEQSIIDAYAESKECNATPQQFDALSVFLKK